ncbi:undecaprenyl-phosphate glucose phosphotransferase [Cognatilysobacter bugurensis]|uniref:Undecaprenyl-phosphate glucose phosphotransferase n=1 Tax=Cognatilysobacter bugurensis TaxID=543356 RepID=A0A918SV54_9GAMM|nr:undecaprenyl-phosphate glucose phosphotransferase [Lysobacter bugurensis]GHA72975.1 undecaprenyl-phosphate glucose phosphotransferase [Lysobacter bugurensis]
MLLAPMPQTRPVGTGASSSSFGALFGWSLRIGDVVAVTVAGVLAYYVRFGSLDIALEYQRHLGRGLLFAILVFTLAPLYRSWRGRGLAGELWTMLGAYSVMFGLAIIYAAALKLTSDISRLWWAWWFIGAVAFGTCTRVGVRGAAKWARVRGIDVRTAVVVGSRRDAMRVVDHLKRQPWAGIHLLGWFDTGNEFDTGPVPEGAHLGSLLRLRDYVEQVPVHQVWLAMPMGAQDHICLALEQLEHSTAEVKFVPDLVGLQLLNHSVEHVAGLSVINLRGTPLTADARLLKALADRAFAALALIALAPLLALLALGVKLSSPGPVLFRQPRHGLDGKIIEVWKFRSMRVHQEHAGQVTQAKKGDSRVTPFGAFLRSTSLDELPQFINVLQGTMSVVGPRPHAVAHNHHYKAQVQHYMQRHRVKPGITGWAQVNGLRGETDTLDKMAARVEYDLFYMQNWSPFLDMKIIAMTVLKGFIGRNAY